MTLPMYVLQLLLRSPKAFPGHMGYVISPKSSASALGSRVGRDQNTFTVHWRGHYDQLNAAVLLKAFFLDSKHA